MSKPLLSLSIFTLLILCLVSAWIAPVFLGIETPAMEFAETDSDPFEFDEDPFLVNRGTERIIHAINLRIEGTEVNRQPASLSRVFSPPRAFFS